MDSERKKLYGRVKHNCTRVPAKFKCVGYRRGRPLYEYDHSGRLVAALKDLVCIMFGQRKL